MIRVEVDPASLALHMQGHAGYDQPGKDIVCAAASMLALTLAIRCRELAEPGEIALEQLDSGEAHIVIAPKEGREAVYTETFRTIRSGLEALSAKYPDCVRFV